MSYKNQEWAKWLWNQVIQTKKVGDTVDLKKSQFVHKPNVCYECYEPTDAEIGNGLVYTFDNTSMCEKHKKEANLKTDKQ